MPDDVLIGSKNIFFYKSNKISDWQTLSFLFLNFRKYLLIFFLVLKSLLLAFLTPQYSYIIHKCYRLYVSVTI